MNENLRSQRWKDVLFLLGLTLFSATSYVLELGFYSDDWHFLQAFEFAPEQSWRGYFDAAFEPHTRGRPLQIAYQAALVTLLGTSATGMHLANTLMLALGSCMLYVLLREFMQRDTAFCITCIYATMPHYSTNRFWFASNQVALSALLCFASGWLLLLYGRRIGRATSRVAGPTSGPWLCR